jgi:hypothetical protein
VTITQKFKSNKKARNESDRNNGTSKAKGMGVSTGAEPRLNRNAQKVHGYGAVSVMARAMH